jgi:hypothetical protein
MKKFTVTHEINCSTDQFWKVFFDKDFNRALFLEELGFPEYEILDQKESDNTIQRRVRGVPKMGVPGPLKKLLGDSFGYEEDGSFDRQSKVWRWKMKTNVLTDKLHNGGALRLEAVGDNKCRRIADMECEAKIFGLGGLMESTTEKELRNGWDKSAVFMNRWLEKNPQ